MVSPLLLRQYEYAAELRDREAKLSDKLQELEKAWQEEVGEENPVVTAEDIAEVVAMWTGIPVTRLSETETERLVNMEDVLHEGVVGQDEAIKMVAKEHFMHYFAGKSPLTNFKVMFVQKNLAFNLIFRSKLNNLLVLLTRKKLCKCFNFAKKLNFNFVKRL